MNGSPRRNVIAGGMVAFADEIGTMIAQDGGERWQYDRSGEFTKLFGGGVPGRSPVHPQAAIQLPLAP